jgi:hypothetical protein
MLSKVDQAVHEVGLILLPMRRSYEDVVPCVHHVVEFLYLLQLGHPNTALVDHSRQYRSQRSKAITIG